MWRHFPHAPRDASDGDAHFASGSVAFQIRAVLGHACGDEARSGEFSSKGNVTYVGRGGFLWGADDGKGRWIRGRSSEEDELAESESELDPDVDSESEEVSPEEVSELESEDDEDDDSLDLLRPTT